MKSTLVWTLVILNALLAGSLLSRYMKPNIAEAQVRRPGDYLMIPVEFTGAPAGAVVVLDSTSGELSAIMADEGQKRLSSMPAINLTNLFDRNSTRERR